MPINIEQVDWVAPKIYFQNCQATGTGTGTWDLGFGTWDLGPGTWDLGPGTWE